MNLLFRDGESTRGKFFTLGCFGLCGLAIYGFVNHRNFTPTEFLHAAAALVALLLSALSVVSVALDRHPKNKVKSFGQIKKVMFLSAWFAISFCIVWLATALGVAALYTQALGQERMELLVVAAKYPEKRGRGCHYIVELSAPSSQKSFAPCVSEEFWGQLRPNDQVSVEIIESSLGLQLSVLNRGPS